MCIRDRSGSSLLPITHAFPAVNARKVQPRTLVNAHVLWSYTTYYTGQANVKHTAVCIVFIVVQVMKLADMLGRLADPRCTRLMKSLHKTHLWRWPSLQRAPHYITVL